MDRDAIHSKRLRQLYDYWRSKATGGRLPSRADIRPADVPQLLPYIFMIDVERNPQRFRFRLVGTQICQWAGRDATGMYTDDPAYGPHGPAITRQYAEVVERGVALYIERPAARTYRDHLYYERLVLPLAADGRTIDILFCGVDDLRPTAELRAGRFRQMWGEPPGQ